jgi:cytosine/adenosine deaminase-related metal-dependent hydrolase
LKSTSALAAASLAPACANTGAGAKDGAVDLELSDLTGSLTPGKCTDLIQVRASNIDMMPMPADPYEALASLGQLQIIKLVMVYGRVLRRGGRFTTLDYPDILQRGIESINGLKKCAGWT